MADDLPTTTSAEEQGEPARSGGWKIVVGFVVLLALVVVGGILWADRDTRRRTASAPVEIVSVEEAERTDSNGHVQTIHVLAYRYEVGGETYEIEGYEDSSFDPDEPRQVCYDPDDPEDHNLRLKRAPCGDTVIG